MSKAKQTLILLFIICVSTLTASTTIVKGNSKGFKDKELVMYTYSDYLSSKKEQIGFTTITANGNYNFEFDTDWQYKINIFILLNKFNIMKYLLTHIGLLIWYAHNLTL